MPLLFWLDIANLIVSTVIAAALALMVLGTGPRRALNRLFALFTLAEANGDCHREYSWRCFAAYGGSQ